MKSDKERAIAEIEAYLIELRRQRPSVTLGDSRSAKGAKTLQEILLAARRVFDASGHAGLSMRRVAAEAGMAVGNVNYYFASKEKLLEAMFREALADFVEAHIAQFNADRDSPLEILLRVVTFYVRDARRNHALFFQMWGYAASEPRAMDMVRELYRPIGRFIYYLVRAANPGFDHQAARRAVFLIFSLEEGMKLFIGMGPADDIAVRDAEEAIRESTRRILAV